jgi:AcrR family transcriptional regulator
VARPAGDIAQRVLDAARTRFLAEGVDGASLRGIARDAGTNLGMVYYYYPTKDALFMAVVEEVYQKLLDDLGRVLSDADPGVEKRIEGLYARLAALSDQEIEVLGLVMREALGSSGRIATLVARFSKGHIPLLLQMFAGAQSRGELRGDLPPLVLVVGTLAAGLVPQLIRRRLLSARAQVSGQEGEPVQAMSGALPAPEQLARLLSRLVLYGMSNSVEKDRRNVP